MATISPYADFTDKVTEDHIERLTNELSHGVDPKDCKWRIYKTKDGTTRAGIFKKGQDPAKQTSMVVQSFVSPPTDLGFLVMDATGVMRFNPEPMSAKQKFIVPVDELNPKYKLYLQWYKAVDKLLNHDRFAFLLKEGKDFLHESLHKSSVAELDSAAQSSFDKRLYYCKVNAPTNKIIATNWVRAKAGGSNLGVSEFQKQAIEEYSPGDPHGFLEFFANSDTALDFRPVKITLPTGGNNVVKPGDYDKLRHGAIGAYQFNVYGIYYASSRDQSSTVTSRVSDIWLLSNGPDREASAKVSNFLDTFGPEEGETKKRKLSEVGSGDEVE